MSGDGGDHPHEARAAGEPPDEGRSDDGRPGAGRPDADGRRDGHRDGRRTGDGGSPGDVTLRARDDLGGATVEVAVADGGRLRRATVDVDGADVDLLTRPPEGAPAASSGWGCFPMAPWAGRIRHGRFRSLGRDVRLDLNHDDGEGGGGGGIEPPEPAPVGELAGADLRRHAIHGTAFSRPWAVVDAAEDRCELTIELRGALGWPFAATATQRLALHPDRLELELVVEAGDGEAFPASIGWHPWFAKPDRLEFDPLARYACDDLGLPTGELVVPDPSPWDDCFVHDGPVRLRYDRPAVPVVTVSASTDHWVVYDGPPDATCVEPQTGPPDAANLRPRLVAPGRPLAISMRIAWRDGAVPTGRDGAAPASPTDG